MSIVSASLTLIFNAGSAGMRSFSTNVRKLYLLSVMVPARLGRHEKLFMETSKITLEK
jgi:hypothetical protein